MPASISCLPKRPGRGHGRACQLIVQECAKPPRFDPWWPPLSPRWFIDHAEEVAKLGFFVFESEDYGVLLGIDAAGFDFDDAYWLIDAAGVFDGSVQEGAPAKTMLDELARLERLGHVQVIQRTQPGRIKASFKRN
jgi:hypothetical protein